MKKYYRVKQDTFLWEEGAILSHTEGSNGYEPIDDVWKKHEDSSEYISSAIVEKSPDWFERVYAVNLATRTVYKLREEAKELLAKSYKQ